MQVAGAFTIDGLGGAFITGHRRRSHNVVGLSLPLLRSSWATSESPGPTSGRCRRLNRWPLPRTVGDWTHDGNLTAATPLPRIQSLPGRSGGRERGLRSRGSRLTRHLRPRPHRQHAGHPRRRSTSATGSTHPASLRQDDQPVGLPSRPLSLSPTVLELVERAATAEQTVGGRGLDLVVWRAVLDRDQEILSRIAELEVERGRIEAETASLMLEFADLRRVQAEVNTDPRRRQPRSRLRCRRTGGGAAPADSHGPVPAC